jgi:hypothetical protein
VLMAIRPRVGRMILDRMALGRTTGRALALILALVAALFAAEGILRLVPRRPDGPGYGAYQRGIVQDHPRFGWVSRPSRTSVLKVAGRPVPYAVNALGMRVRTESDQPDLSKPSLVVAGESVGNGIGLPYDQTFAALAGHALGLEVVNIAEGGYGLDQAHLRLIDVLPRLEKPAVVVIVFVPVQVGRSLRDDRPHLALDGAGHLQLLPAASGLLANTRLHQIVHNRLPVASEKDLQRALAVSRAVLQASATEVRARGARPLFVIPSQNAAWMIRLLFGGAGVPDSSPHVLPHIVVDLDATQIIPRDGHPNADGARRIAAAIVAAIRDLDCGSGCQTR